MLFSSLFFLFAFLPILLLLYHTVCRKNIAIQNGLLLLASLFFYAWGEPKFVFVMVASIFINYLFGIWIHKTPRRAARLCLIFAIVCNIGLLFIFKYLNFTISNLDRIFGIMIPQTEITLPIGISFFTFQAMSYVIDVYRGTVKVQQNPFYLALYISFFPQLIAGPIVRYSTIESQIRARSVSLDGFSEGVRRFIIGFLKKVLLANNVALIADQAFSIVDTSELSVALAWLGSFAYTLQIYFDFSGYSDMAIGLGKMFGFQFLENFNYPYLSKSISEFWRRWHISLGMWFRDYVYIPLGGSHVENSWVLVRNLLIVWTLTGVWHGANWTFLWWGLFYFFLLTGEKLLRIPNRWSRKSQAWIYMIFVFLCVNGGWILFRAESINGAMHYFIAMLGLSGNLWVDNLAVQYFCENWVFLLAGTGYAFAGFKWLRHKIEQYRALDACVSICTPFVYIGLFLVAVTYLVIGAYNPFIYFNF